MNIKGIRLSGNGIERTSSRPQRPCQDEMVVASFMHGDHLATSLLELVACTRHYSVSPWESAHTVASMLNCEHPASLVFRALISDGVERLELVRTE